MSPEEEIKKLLGISAKEKVFALLEYRKGQRTYLRVETYCYREKRKKFYHVPRKLEAQVVELFRKLRKEKELEEELRREVRRLLAKYRNPELIRKVIEELLKAEIGTHALGEYRKRARELFRKHLRHLLRLYSEGLERLTYTEALYLIANFYELYRKEHGEEETNRYIEEKVIPVILLRDRNRELKYPAKVLARDLFLREENLPYGFLSSPLLVQELEEEFLSILSAEYRSLLLKEAVSWYENLGEEFREKLKNIAGADTGEVLERLVSSFLKRGNSTTTTTG
ncbi:MAG: hypothetical protein Q9N34_09200 [Aquificota bacterium]|nr:hypothetical protein [Aquificota bacterium]